MILNHKLFIGPTGLALSGNAADIQVQKGVGSSLYGSGAFGGSVNIQTDNFAFEERASVVTSYSTMSGNSHYTAAYDYSTGFFNNDRTNFYFRYERKEGDSYINDTGYDGHSFYLGLMHYLTETQTLTFNFHGAPQKHHQAGNVQQPALLEQFGRQWNRRNHPYQENYYFKPVAEIHYDWNINDSSTFKATAFFTSGRGGGRYLRNDKLNMDTGISETQAQTFKPNRNYDPRRIYGSSWRNDSQSHHKQFGLNFNYKHVLSNQFTYVFGGEYRNWKGLHFSDSENFEFIDEQVETVERRYDYDGLAITKSMFFPCPI